MAPVACNVMPTEEHSLIAPFLRCHAALLRAGPAGRLTIQSRSGERLRMILCNRPRDEIALALDEEPAREEAI